MEIVSVEMLQQLGACLNQVDKFKSMFGEGKILITRVRLDEAHRKGLNVEWWFCETHPEFKDEYEGRYKQIQACYLAKCKANMHDSRTKRKELPDQYTYKHEKIWDVHDDKYQKIWDEWQTNRINLIADLLGLD